MNKGQLKRIYIGLILMLIVSSALLLVVESDKQEPINYVNQLRIYSNESYQKIQRDLDLNKEIHKEKLINPEKEDLYITIINLEGTILFSNSPYTDAQNYKNIDEVFYMDNAYMSANENAYKIALPLYNGESVQGFAIYEKALETHIRMEFWKIVLVCIGAISLLSVIIVLGKVIYSPYPDELRQLEKGLLNMTKGIYTKLKAKENSQYANLYSSYNILSEELEYLIQQQQYNEDQRKIFINKISHELKTPISTIKAYIEGLKNNIAKDREKQENYVNIIHDKMNQLTNIINDLFVFTQEDANQLKYNFEECYADSIVESIFDNINKQNDKITTCENLLPKCIINADKNRLEQVILNLYNNAKKHTSENDNIKLIAYRQDNDVIIEVNDSGDGIPASELPYIFDSYYQGTRSKKTDYQGVGLGLTICKTIIEAHKGSIKVKSEYKKGTSMYVSIPIL